MAFDIKKISSALVFGAGHGIGLGIVKELLNTNSQTHVYCTYQNQAKAKELIDLRKKENSRLSIFQLDASKEKELQELSEDLKSQTKELQVIMNCIGILHHKALKPERGLQDISLSSLKESFHINSFITPMIAKYFHHFLKDAKQSCFVGISAKVGSIKDNKMGGWYAYRASKTALNMFLKTIALELTRKRYKTIVLAIHPGTTRTELSEPYTKQTNLKVHSVSETATNILNVINGRDQDDSGSFYSWDGQELPW